jgi:hypothetical protein
LFSFTFTWNVGWVVSGSVLGFLTPETPDMRRSTSVAFWASTL